MLEPDRVICLIFRSSRTSLKVTSSLLIGQRRFRKRVRYCYSRLLPRRERTGWNFRIHTQYSKVVFSIFYYSMKDSTFKHCRQEPRNKLSYWNHFNDIHSTLLPLSFTSVDCACLSSQSPSPSPEIIFSDLIRMEDRQCQSLLRSYMQVTGVIRLFSKNCVAAKTSFKRVPLHHESSSFMIQAQLVATARK